MNIRCVDVAFYWTPEEAGAIVDYLDRLRDTIWELYCDDIISCRTTELDEQCDPRQRHLCFDDEIDRIDESDTQASTSCSQCGRPTQKSGVRNDNTTPRGALPSFDDLPSLSDENIGDMLNLLRALFMLVKNTTRTQSGAWTNNEMMNFYIRGDVIGRNRQ